MNILHEIAVKTKERIEAQKKIVPPEELIKRVEAMMAAESNVDSTTDSTTDTFPFEKALKAQSSKDIAFICEVKKASPSKGIIAEEFPYTDIAKEYETAGATAISVLTEPYYFMGQDRYLSEIARTVEIPLLRKDFTIDSYMIYEAKLLGASAVLLICSILDAQTLSEYIDITHSLGLSALVEVHDEDEIKMALSAGARIIGVNNRNLKTFKVDISLSERLRKCVPPDIIFISESGISTPDDVAKLRAIDADAVLIGESIMKSADKKVEIEKLRGYQFDCHPGLDPGSPPKHTNL